MKLGRAVLSMLGTAPFANALTIGILGASMLAPTIRALCGWAGLLGIIGGLVALAVVSLVARQDDINWPTAVPFSVLAFLAIAALSLVWSTYQWATLASLAYLAAFTSLGVYVAVARDMIQIIRAFGDVIRFVLAVSLAVEVLSGLLIDTPISFIGVDGNLPSFGPAQGILGSSNQLGFVAIIGLITFVVEVRTRSVPTGLGVASLILGGLATVLTRSPVVFGTAAVVAVVMAALYAIRRAPVATRNTLQYVLLGLGTVGALLAWIFRAPIIAAFDAADVLAYRLGIWRQVTALLDLHPVEGWGWIGAWRVELTPFSAITVAGESAGSARSAWVDVWFQLGLLGLAAFVGIVGLAFVRAWLLAGRKRSVIYTWPALVLAGLIVYSFAESAILVEFGWMTFVICAVKAGREISWRKAFEPPLDPPLPLSNSA